MKTKKALKSVAINLAEMPFIKVCEIAYAMSGKTYAQIAEEMGCGKETIHRYFTDPTYNPPSYKIPKLCQVLGNYLLIEWQCIQAGGHFILNEEIFCNNQTLETQVAELTKEFSDILREDGKARLDGKYNADELNNLEKEIEDLLKKAEQIKRYIWRMKEALR